MCGSVRLTNIYGDYGDGNPRAGLWSTGGVGGFIADEKLLREP